ncbi:MAG TPA: hypothetical protein DDW93_06270, partial [Firmicutes bacterium]|nr:hypothetical protein [Bacillota bacterium]
QELVATHGGGSPQAQKMAIYAQSQLKNKAAVAKRLAGIE